MAIFAKHPRFNKHLIIVKVDFHCRVIFTCVRTHTLTGFTCVNKLKTTYVWSDVNVKVERGSTFTFTLPCCFSTKFQHFISKCSVYGAMLLTHREIKFWWRCFLSWRKTKDLRESTFWPECKHSKWRRRRRSSVESAEYDRKDCLTTKKDLPNACKRRK